MEVAKHGLLEELGVQRGDAVDGVAADAGEVRHPDRFSPASSMIDRRRTSSIVARVPAPHVVEEAAVDLEDDLQVARQERAKQRHGHFSSASDSSVWFV